MSVRECHKSIILLVAFLPLIFLTGCWSSVELNNRSFVRIILLDKSKEGIELTLSFPLPNRLIPGQSGGTGGLTGTPYTYISKTGHDIGEAYRLIQSDISRAITFGQTSVVVVGRELAKDGIGEILEFISREPRFHINTNLYVAPGKAKEITSIPIIFERFPVDILLAYERDLVTIDTTAKDCLVASYYGGDMILPLLKVETKEIPSEKNKEQKWLGTNGAAIFRQGKLKTTLTTYEMRGAMWILGKMKDAEISVASPTDGKPLNFMINQSHSRIRPVISGDQIVFHIDCKADASLISSQSNLPLQDPNQIKKLEQSLVDLVEIRMKKAIERSKNDGADIFQLSSYLDWYDPPAWKKLAPHWREEYRQRVKVLPHVSITIKRIGTMKDPVRFQMTE
ncbi:Ger(x)C family spore germination protein [Brevibacillus choshinensis]|uniref:Ger(x)C family spore germination protein n=1 Tax=Brevibacillus choshinensis TaxID=54911 RepID=UPI002E1CE7D9|nr:Ger(x)C family spore germination protein [Brevibacillus choshinensis]MED4750490.1 Ger(x)C family spore germination protein [Brevibacillus choshinensis]